MESRPGCCLSHGLCSKVTVTLLEGRWMNGWADEIKKSRVTQFSFIKILSFDNNVIKYASKIMPF